MLRFARKWSLCYRHTEGGITLLRQDLSELLLAEHLLQQLSP
jgi:hypothetical protein